MPSGPLVALWLIYEQGAVLQEAATRSGCCFTEGWNLYGPLGVGQTSDPDHGERPHPHHAVQVSGCGGGAWGREGGGQPRSGCVDVPLHSLFWRGRGRAVPQSGASPSTISPIALMLCWPTSTVALRWGRHRKGREDANPPAAPVPIHGRVSYRPEVQKTCGKGGAGTAPVPSCSPAPPAARRGDCLHPSWAAWARRVGVGVPCPEGWGLEPPAWLPVVLLWRYLDILGLNKSTREFSKYN